MGLVTYTHRNKRARKAKIGLAYGVQTYEVRHDAEFVERRLSIEQHHISIYQVTLHCISKLKHTRETH